MPRENGILHLTLTSLTTCSLSQYYERSHHLHLQMTEITNTALKDSQVIKTDQTIQKTQNQSAHQVQQIDVVDHDEAVPRKIAEAHMLVSILFV